MSDIFRTPKGRTVRVHCRPGTSDWMVANSILAEDEYRLAGLPELGGTALDVGAHIGAATLALLADHPALRVIAIEPLAENVEAIEANLAENGFTGRTTVIRGAIGTTTVAYDYAGEPGDFNRVNRYIGHLSMIVPDAQRVAMVPEIAPVFGHLALAKWDCEGCEWSGLAAVSADCDYVVGEWHGDPGIERLEEIFAATHTLTTTNDGAAGLFFAVPR